MSWLLVNCLVASTLKAGSLSPRMGLLWIETPQKLTHFQYKQWERDLLKTLENVEGKAVIRHPLDLKIPEAVYRNIEKVKALKKLSQELWNLIDNEETPQKTIEEQGRRLIVKQGKLLSQMSRGVFGPEIQKAKLIQAAWYLVIQNQEKAHQMIEEARALHPQKELIWEEEGFSPVAEVFDSLVREKSQASVKGLCKIKHKGSLSSNQLWVNGFKFTEAELQEIYPGRYLVNSVQADSRAFEEILSCHGQDILWDDLKWSVVGLGGRSEQWLWPQLSPGNEMILLLPQKGSIKKIQFSENKEVRGIRGSQLFTNPPRAEESRFLESLKETPKKEGDLSAASRLSLNWFVLGVVAALGMAYGLTNMNDGSATIPVSIRNGR